MQVCIFNFKYNYIKKDRTPRGDGNLKQDIGMMAMTDGYKKG